jgi:signal transduction histidine kinase
VDPRLLAEQEGALRRVATAVAHGAAPADVFAVLAREFAQLLHVPLIEMVRFDPGAVGVVVGAHGNHPFPVGSLWPLDVPSVMGTVYATSRSARIDDYPDLTGVVADVANEASFRSAVGVPIVVDGTTWGVTIAITTGDDVLPQGTERRLADFTDLVAAAIANTQARDELRVLAEEQAALRRLATLVARGAEPDAVFAAVCEETARVIGSSSVNLARFAPPGYTETVAGWSRDGSHIPPGEHFPMEEGTVNVIVQRERAPGRVEDYALLDGELAALLRERGVRTEIGAPVIVDGEVWGALIAGLDEGSFPAGDEHRVASFAGLIATAVSNAEARAELLASRARIVTAADQGRAKLARDIHDGAQQRLVSAIVLLQLADQRLDADVEDARGMLRDALSHAQAGIDELRELAAGVHPSILTNGGLRAAVEALAEHSRVPVHVLADARRFPEHIEAGAYFLVAEAITNSAKHAHASRVDVAIAAGDRVLEIDVRDDGVGGADPAGSGMRGLEDRVEALGGTFRLQSPAGGGTAIHATLPLPG